MAVDWLTTMELGLLTALCVIWLKYRSFSKKLDHIPGPSGYPFIGDVVRLADRSVLHKDLTQLAKEHGPVFKVRFVNTYLVVLSGLDAIYEMLMLKGRDTAGRMRTWRMDYALENTGILSSTFPDGRWALLRKVSHRHLKQYGEGMSRLQDVITDVAQDMFEAFRSSQGQPMDPQSAIAETALKTIGVFVTGKRYSSDDKIIALMREYELKFAFYISNMVPVQYPMVDALPWLRHLLPGTWANISKVRALEDELWRHIKEEVRDNPKRECLAQILLRQIRSEENSPGKETTEIFTELDAKKTCTSLLLAGLITTSNTLYAFLNILAHHKAVQDKMAQELRGYGEKVTLADRPNLHYTRASIYELLRYFPVANQGAGRAATGDTEIQGFQIPKGTIFITNIWELHHDESFWGDPETFRPERFLDSEGHVVLADHLNRKHLLPFGVGLRVCLGESLALARLFLWTAQLLLRYEIVPAPGSDPSLCEAENYYCESVLRSHPYMVMFNPRVFDE